MGELTRTPALARRGDSSSDRQRRSPRLGQQDREAALLRGAVKAKLVVLNLSQAGIMGECAAPLFEGDRIEVVLDKRDPVPATTRWVEGRRFGAVFDTPLPFEALWPAAPGRGFGPQPGRTKTDRTPVDAAAVLRVNDRPVPARIRNVSVRGMLIDIAVRLPARHPVEVVIDGWPVIRGSVAWCRDGSCGLRLLEPLSEEQILELVLARRS